MAKIEINLDHNLSTEDLIDAGYDPDNYPYTPEGKLHQNHKLSTHALESQGYSREAALVHPANRNREANLERQSRILSAAAGLAEAALTAPSEVMVHPSGVVMIPQESADIVDRRQTGIHGS